LYDCNFAHVISTHAVNISAHLLWMDFTGCSMIRNSQHQLHERHEQQCQIREICTSVYMLSSSIQPFIH